jgi:hypothetical protein
MFASMTFRLPESLRRAGAYLKAFAFLEDPPPRPRAPATHRTRGSAHPAHSVWPSREPRPPSGPSAWPRPQPQPVNASVESPSSGHYEASTTTSRAHRHPPRTRIDRRTARRPGSVPAGLQPCLTPVRAQPDGARVVRSLRRLPHGSHGGS